MENYSFDGYARYEGNDISPCSKKSQQRNEAIAFMPIFERQKQVIPNFIPNHSASQYSACNEPAIGRHGL